MSSPSKSDSLSDSTGIWVLSGSGGGCEVSAEGPQIRDTSRSPQMLKSWVSSVSISEMPMPPRFLHVWLLFRQSLRGCCGLGDLSYQCGFCLRSASVRLRSISVQHVFCRTRRVVRFAGGGSERRYQCCFKCWGLCVRCSLTCENAVLHSVSGATGCIDPTHYVVSRVVAASDMSAVLWVPRVLLIELRKHRTALVSAQLPVSIRHFLWFRRLSLRQIWVLFGGFRQFCFLGFASIELHWYLSVRPGSTGIGAPGLAVAARVRVAAVSPSVCCGTGYAYGA